MGIELKGAELGPMGLGFRFQCKPSHTSEEEVVEVFHIWAHCKWIFYYLWENGENPFMFHVYLCLAEGAASILHQFYTGVNILTNVPIIIVEINKT